MTSNVASETPTPTIGCTERAAHRRPAAGAMHSSLRPVPAPVQEQQDTADAMLARTLAAHGMSRIRPAERRSARRPRAEGRTEEAVTLFSVNGALRDLYEEAAPGARDEPRAHGYAPVAIGQPLLVRYLHFHLRHPGGEGEHELMVSTFLKADENKSAAAEAINYFDDDARFEGGALTIRDFGGEKYGHPLVYYSRSYRGESLYLTTRIMELDGVDGATRRALRGSLTTLGGLPMFAQYLPLVAAGGAAAGVLARLVNLFDRDDAIIDGHNVDLHFDRMHARRLQSGRILCLPRSPAPKAEVAARYRLRPDNVLVARDDEAAAYTGASYFVLQVDARRNRALEDFDHFVGAADLLAKTNRRGAAADVLNEVVDVARKAADVDGLLDIEKLALDAADARARQEIRAIYKSLSPEIQALYSRRTQEILSAE